MKSIDGGHIVLGCQAHGMPRQFLRRWNIFRRLFQEGLHKLNFFVTPEKCGLWKYLQAEVVTDHELPFGIVQDFQGPNRNRVITTERSYQNAGIKIRPIRHFQTLRDDTVLLQGLRLHTIASFRMLWRDCVKPAVLSPKPY